MIKHIVALSLVEDTDRAELSDVMAGLAALKIDGFVGFEHGENLDLEKKSQAYPYGFICQFRDEAALARYTNDTEHQKLGARLVAMCKGGADGIFVMDISV